MAEQGRVRQSTVHTQRTVHDSEDGETVYDPVDEPTADELKEQLVDPVKVMQGVFTAMKKHFDNARKEALSLPNSDEMAAMLGHLNMAEVAMDAMVSQAEGSLV